MIRRPPRSTLDRSSAASDVYKRQSLDTVYVTSDKFTVEYKMRKQAREDIAAGNIIIPVSYTHLRAHETVLDLVCRLLLEKKKTYINKEVINT